MDLGIKVFRDFELLYLVKLLYLVSPEGIAPNLELFDFLRIHQSSIFNSKVVNSPIPQFPNP